MPSTVGSLTYKNFRAFADRSTPLFDTRTDTRPGACGGLLQTSTVDASQVVAVPTTPPNVHDNSDVFSKPVPRMVTTVPPFEAGPSAGQIESIVTSREYLNIFPEKEKSMPLEVTSAGTTPAECGGDVQRIAVLEMKTAGTAVDPNLHAMSVVLRKYPPSKTTAVPPVVIPTGGLSVMTFMVLSYVNRVEPTEKLALSLLTYEDGNSIDATSSGPRVNTKTRNHHSSLSKFVTMLIASNSKDAVCCMMLKQVYPTPGRRATWCVPPWGYC